MLDQVLKTAGVIATAGLVTLRFVEFIQRFVDFIWMQQRKKRRRSR
jgi:hypothetical protein